MGRKGVHCPGLYHRQDRFGVGAGGFRRQPGSKVIGEVHDKIHDAVGGDGHTDLSIIVLERCVHKVHPGGADAVLLEDHGKCVGVDFLAKGHAGEILRCPALFVVDLGAEALHVGRHPFMVQAELPGKDHVVDAQQGQGVDRLLLRLGKGHKGKILLGKP